MPHCALGNIWCQCCDCGAMDCTSFESPTFLHIYLISNIYCHYLTLQNILKRKKNLILMNVGGCGKNHWQICVIYLMGALFLLIYWVVFQENVCRQPFNVPRLLTCTNISIWCICDYWEDKSFYFFPSPLCWLPTLWFKCMLVHFCHTKVMSSSASAHNRLIPLDAKLESLALSQMNMGILT